MATNNRYVVPYRRKREGRTDYHKRLKMLSGHATRLVIRKSLHNMRLQLIDYEPQGDKVLLSASTLELRKLGYKGGTGNLPAAYLCGVLLGTKAKKKGIARAVPDIGITTPVAGAVVFAAIAGCREAGLDVPADEKALPSKDRLIGKHIAAYAQLLRKDEAAYKKAFAHYLKDGLEPDRLPEHVQETRKRIA
jgi:large subunit ribosomal protein L18